MVNSAPGQDTPRRTPRCPICKKPAADGLKPFCSKRCADIDLGKWFSNAYAIPGDAHDDEAENPGNQGGGDPGPSSGEAR